MSAELRPGPLLDVAIAMQRQGQPFDVGKEPAWSDHRPHRLCQVALTDYPAPRECAALTEPRCHLGHPANCRWLIEALIEHELEPERVVA